MKPATAWKREFIREAKQHLGERCKDILVRTTLEALVFLANRSPVWTGSYVSSHRIGHKTPSSAPWVNLHSEAGVSEPAPPEIARKMQAEVIRRERENLLSSDIEPYDVLHITNNTPYGQAVELRHSVYGQAAIAARLTMEALANRS